MEGRWRMCYLLPAAAVAVATLVTVCRQGATEREREGEKRRRRVAHPGNLQRKLSTVPIVCLGASDAYHRHHKTIFYAACFGLEITPKGTAERARIAANGEEEMKEEKGRRREGSQQYERRFRSRF